MISVVMSYYNRLPQFLATLNSLTDFKFENLEVIVVDDGSDEEHRLEEAVKSWTSFQLKLARLEPENKKYCNPCVPFQIGFRLVEGEITIIQNPECMHIGNILQYVWNNAKNNDYLTFAAFSADPELSKKLLKTKSFNGRMKYLKNLGTKSASIDGQFNAYYNHSIYRPMYYHFCSAIMTRDLLDLGGFDQRYAKGVGYDDDEFRYRIGLKGMNMKIVDEPFVVHQYHKGFCGQQDFKPIQNNYFLYNQLTLPNKDWRVNQTK